MVFRCQNIQTHYNEAVIYLNFGTPKTNKFSIWTNGKFIILGVPILRHIRVFYGCKVFRQMGTSVCYCQALFMTSVLFFWMAKPFRNRFAMVEKTLLLVKMLTFKVA